MTERTQPLSQGSTRPRRHSGPVVRALWVVLAASLTVYLLAFPVRTPAVEHLLDAWVFHIALAAACVLTVLRTVLRRTERLAWGLLAGGMTSWLAGDLYWFAVQRPLGADAPSPAPSDLLYFGLYPCAVAALVLLISRHTSHSRTLWLDGLVAGLGASAVGSLWFQATTGTGGSATAVLIALAFPIADLVLLGLTLAALAAQGWRVPARWWLASAGVALLVVADANFLLKSAAGTYETGSPGDAGWVLGFALFALAAWQPSSTPAPAPSGRPALLVPILVTALSVALLVARTDRPVPPLAVALAAAALVVSAARIALAFRELQLLVESRRLSLIDELTGLGNRRLLLDRLSTALRERRSGEGLAVLLLDLDRFKEVNDALGHHVGDELLRRIGPRIAGALRDGDLLTRLGGDEFALLLSPGSDSAYASVVAGRIRDALRAPFRLDDVELHLSASVGIAVCPDHALTASGLLQCADVAMYDAKRSRAGFRLYTPGSDQNDRGRLETIAQLHAALTEGQLVCHYQPQSDLRSGDIVGAEALIRWEHPERGLLLPADFLGLVAEVGLMDELTRQVVAMALADCQQWRRSGADLTVSVNLSGRSLSDVSLPAHVARLLRSHRLPGRALLLEVTEDVLVVDTGVTQEVVAQLQALGVRLSIDDYGTGYSSLTHLRTLPVHELKLDRSYIAGLGTDDRDAAIVRSTVALAHALGLTVVAEGVETQDDWQELARLRCDHAQGFLLSAPLAQPVLLRWLQERRTAVASETAHATG